MKKVLYSFFSSLWVSIAVSIVVSIYMDTAFGGGVSVQTFTMVLPMCTAIGAVVGTVFATIMPVGPIAVKIAHCLGARPGSLAEVLLRNMSIITIMLFVMCFAITAITHFCFGAPYPGDVSFAADTNAFLNAWFKPIPALWGPSYVVSLMVDPLSAWLTVKIVGAPPAPETV